MADELTLEVEKFANLTIEKWLDKGDRPDTSWMMMRPWAAAARIAWPGLWKVLKRLTRRKPHLVRKARLTHAGRMRRVIQLRLDGLPRVLLGINVERLDDPSFVEALQDDFYAVLVAKLYGTGTGAHEIQAARGRWGEHTGFTLPLFGQPGAAAPGVEAVELSIVPLPALDSPEAARLAIADVDELERAQSWIDAGGWGSSWASGLADADASETLARPRPAAHGCTCNPRPRSNLKVSRVPLPCPVHQLPIPGF